MNKLVVFFAVLAVATAAQVDYSDDLDNSLDASPFSEYDQASSRMVGGTVVTDQNAFTYMIAIQPRYTTPNGQQRRAPVCSGVLIRGVNATTLLAQNWVLTSAHCALSGTVYDLFAGSKRITTQAPNDTVSANMTVVNEEYRQSQLTGDLALIPTTIQANATGVSVALLATNEDAERSYLINTVTMAGWGYPNDVFNAPSTLLRQLSSWVVPNWYCAARHLTLPIRRTHMCTAGLPNRGPCTGDSGAPLVATSSSDNNTASRVVGIVTLTPSNGCSRGKPGIFTRIGNYLSWIVQVTNYDSTA